MAIPIAVAINASPIGPATTSNPADLVAEIFLSASMIPQTVPNSPMNGAVEPMLASTAKPDSRRFCS